MSWDNNIFVLISNVNFRKLFIHPAQSAIHVLLSSIYFTPGHEPVFGYRTQEIYSSLCNCLVFDALRRRSWKVLLALGHEPFEALDVLPLRFIVKDVGHVFTEDLFSPRSRVDAHHGHANGPGGVADGHLQVSVVGLDVIALQAVLHDLRQTLHDVVGQRPLLEALDQGLQVRLRLRVGSGVHLPPDAELLRLRTRVVLAAPQLQNQLNKLEDDLAPEFERGVAVVEVLRRLDQAFHCDDFARERNIPNAVSSFCLQDFVEVGLVHPLQGLLEIVPQTPVHLRLQDLQPPQSLEGVVLRLAEEQDGLLPFPQPPEDLGAGELWRVTHLLVDLVLRPRGLALFVGGAVFSLIPVPGPDAESLPVGICLAGAQLGPLEVLLVALHDIALLQGPLLGFDLLL